MALDVKSAVSHIVFLVPQQTPATNAHYACQAITYQQAQPPNASHAANKTAQYVQTVAHVNHVHQVIS